MLYFTVTEKDKNKKKNATSHSYTHKQLSKRRLKVQTYKTAPWHLTPYNTLA